MKDEQVKFKTYLQILIGLTIAVFVAELAYVIADEAFNWDENTVFFVALRNSCFIPTLINAAIIGVEYTLLGNPNIKLKYREMFTYLGIIVMTASLCMFHIAHLEMCCAFPITVLASAVYGKREHVKIAFMASLAGIFSVFAVRFIRLLSEEDNESIDVVFVTVTFFICLTMLVASFVVSELIRKTIEHASHEMSYQLDTQANLKEKTRIDGMTGLYNHSAFYELLSREMKAADREGRPLTIAIADIDNFKSVNDTYGHSNGDEVLITLSEIFRKTCDGYLVCRYGGEEFGVIFPGLKTKEAAEYMQKALETIREVNFEWCDHPITFSCGVSRFYDIRISPEQYFMQADRYLYKAKYSGKNKVVTDLDPAE